MILDNFTLKNYERCIDLAISKNCNFYRLCDWKKSIPDNQRKIILRHDVDTQIDIALEMANIESNKGVKSSYFFRLHSHAYNFLCIKDLVKILKIKNMGHEIGLHYESDFYYMLKKDSMDMLLKEIDLINNLLEIKVKSICPHEPTRTNSFYIDDVNLSKYVQAYDKKIFSHFKYISDSSCRWRDGSFYENLTNTNSNLYVLTHPYWWYQTSPIENY